MRRLDTKAWHEGLTSLTHLLSPFLALGLGAAASPEVLRLDKKLRMIFAVSVFPLPDSPLITMDWDAGSDWRGSRRFE